MWAEDSFHYGISIFSPSTSVLVERGIGCWRLFSQVVGDHLGKSFKVQYSITLLKSIRQKTLPYAMEIHMDHSEPYSIRYLSVFNSKSYILAWRCNGMLHGTSREKIWEKPVLLVVTIVWTCASRTYNPKIHIYVLHVLLEISAYIYLSSSQNITRVYFKSCLIMLRSECNMLSWQELSCACVIYWASKNFFDIHFDT